MIERLLSRFLQAGLLDSPDADALADVLMAEGDFSPSQYDGEDEEDAEMEVDEPQDPPENEGDQPHDGNDGALHFSAAFSSEVMPAAEAEAGEGLIPENERCGAYLSICKNRGFNGPPMVEAPRPLTARELEWFQTFVWIKTSNQLILVSDLLRWLAQNPLCLGYDEKAFRLTISNAERK